MAILVLLFATVCIGLVEEFAKIIVITSRIKSRWDMVPASPECWWRHLKSPRGLVLAGIAAGGGFASMENFSYIVQASLKDGLDSALFTAFARGITAVPSHMLLTGSTACGLAIYRFGDRDNSKRLLWWLWILGVPALLHGAYDGSIMLVALYAKAQESYPQWCFMGAFACSFIAMIGVFLSRWRKVCRVQVVVSSQNI
eukprot:GHVL01005369.1.p1 GENE.GHVL01005369.1~~GHVL01005369.1.p1  ORF type:complete len:199 (+),score=17.15 GHVL01005369.1:516-1112(+)